VLRSSIGQPSRAEATTVEVTATEPSGHVVRQSVTFAPASLPKPPSFSLSESASPSSAFRQENDALLESTNYVNVAFPPPVQKQKRRSRKAAQSSRPHSELRPRFEFARPRSSTPPFYQEPNPTNRFHRHQPVRNSC